MRCNQVTINIERFGKYVPEAYPADVQRIHVYCDDFQSVYAALSKAYALVINELNEYESIGVRTDVYTNEFSHVNDRKLHGTIPLRRQRYEEDVSWQYQDSTLEFLNDYVWAYENSDKLLEAIKNCKETDSFIPLLKEQFGLNDIQIRKLSQMRLDMLTRERYEQAKKEIETIKKKKENFGKSYCPEERRVYLKERIKDIDQKIEALERYFVVADHCEEIVKKMMEIGEPRNFVDFMKERFGFSYNQSREIRYLTVNDFSMEERSKKEEQMKKLKDDREMYSRWMEGDSNGTYI